MTRRLMTQWRRAKEVARRLVTRRKRMLRRMRSSLVMIQERGLSTP